MIFLLMVMLTFHHTGIILLKSGYSYDKTTRLSPSTNRTIPERFALGMIERGRIFKNCLKNR